MIEVNTNFIIATVVLTIEVILVCALLMARYGARRLNLKIHHGVVYSITIINGFIIVFWMGQRALRFLPRQLERFPDSFMFFTHVVLGLTTMTLALGLTSLYLVKVVKKETIPLPLIRRTKPIMITTAILWILTFIVGVINYLNARIL